MMMNIYYSSNRNNIDDTNKLFYKVVISPILQNIHHISITHLIYCSPFGSIVMLCDPQSVAFRIRLEYEWLHTTSTAQSHMF